MARAFSKRDRKLRFKKHQSIQGQLRHALKERDDAVDFAGKLLAAGQEAVKKMNEARENAAMLSRALWLLADSQISKTLHIATTQMAEFPDDAILRQGFDQEEDAVVFAAARKPAEKPLLHLVTDEEVNAISNAELIDAVKEQVEVVNEEATS